MNEVNACTVTYESVHVFKTRFIFVENAIYFMLLPPNSLTSVAH